MYQSLGIYFETLYELNRNLISFCGVTLDDNCQWNYNKYIIDVICAIPKLVPYSCNSKKGEYIINNKDGLIEFSNELLDIKEEYQTILNNHYKFLESVKKIRNKYEHKMHKVLIPEIGYGSICGVDLICKFDDEQIRLQDKDFIEFVKELNLLFSNIQRFVETYAYKESKQYYPYFQRLFRYKFSDFNLIYDSELLRVFAKAMIPF